MEEHCIDKDIKERIARIEAIHEIKNLMGRYQAYHFVKKEIPATWELFAIWREDCSVEIGDLGMIAGTDKVIDLWKNTKPDDSLAACSLHLASTPVIEVAGNGQTAKAIFQSMGLRSGYISETNKLRDAWTIGKYAVDFIKNPDTQEWKIWHFHFFGLIQTPYHASFVQKLFGDLEDRPTRFPDAQPSLFERELSLDMPTHPFPFPPLPYYDYDGDFRWQYGGADKELEYGVEYLSCEKIYNVNYPMKI